MIEQCNFKTTDEVPLCLISHYEFSEKLTHGTTTYHGPMMLRPAKCVLEGNCVLYQVYSNQPTAYPEIRGRAGQEGDRGMDGMKSNIIRKLKKMSLYYHTSGLVEEYCIYNMRLQVYRKDGNTFMNMSVRGPYLYNV